MKNFFLKIFIFLNIFEKSMSFSNIPNTNTNTNTKSIKSIIKTNQGPYMNHYICPEYLDKFTRLLDEDQSETIVKGITNFLPKVDGFGGYVLHTNDILINYILNNDIIPLERKKSIILFLIEFSQRGDSMGSHILQFYHDFVNCLL